DGDRRRLREFLVNLPVHGIFFGRAARSRLPLEMVGPMFPSLGGLPSYLSHPLFSDNFQVPSFSVRGMFS
ncbi:MAG: hypothetical protein ACKN9U_02585, partial [Pirellulaceae bacterium]